MKKILLLLLFPFHLMGQALQVSAHVRFLALGDSYTIGQSVPTADNWPNQLKDSLAARGIATDTLRIIATTGWRTDNLLAAITGQGLDSVHFNLVSLLIGVNNQYQGTPFSQYVAQFPQLIDSAIQYAGGDTGHVFIVSIPDYAYTPFGLQAGDTATITAQIDTYNLVGRQIADSFHIKYFNITPISEMGLAQPGLVASDGLHPSPLQYSMWVDLMLQSIDSTLDTAMATGIDAIDYGKITAYPNPAATDITIDFGNSTNNSVQVYDIWGRLLISQAMYATTAKLSIADLSAGTYLVKANAQSYVSVVQIVKE